MIQTILAAFTAIPKIASLIERLIESVEKRNRLEHMRMTAELRQKKNKAQTSEEYDELSKDLQRLLAGL